MQLYKGGIPARYGGRASSVLDIRQREGSSKKFKGEGGVGLLFSRLTLEGPIKKDKLSFLVSLCSPKDALVIYLTKSNQCIFI